MPDDFETADDADGAAAQPAPASRRTLLKAAAGGAAGIALGLLGQATPTEAAVGSAMLLGRSNSASTASTSLTTKSTSTAYKVAQTGTGPGVATSVVSNGRAALTASNLATTTGTGSAIVADGRKNRGLTATTAAASRAAIVARNAAGGSGIAAGVGVRATSGIAGDTYIDGLTYPAAGEFAGATGVTAVGAEGCGLFAASKNWLGIWAETHSASAAAISAANRAGGSAGTAGAGMRVLAGSATDGDIDLRFSYTGVYRAAGEFAGAVGVIGVGSDSYGVYGYTWGAAGVHGSSTNGYGVEGVSNNSYGVYGTTGSSISFGVYAENPQAGATALYSKGRAAVNGNMNVSGTLSKGGGSFKIDHPLDPANQFLYHSFVESPDMKNVYDGLVSLDAHGEATVDLPDWFDALNRDRRYQLTAVGTAMPNLHVRDGVRKNRFTVAGGKPGGEVSWQVTGIRKDAWAEANRIPVEAPKTGIERGRYLHPEVHGKPESSGIHHAIEARARKSVKRG